MNSKKSRCVSKQPFFKGDISHVSEFCHAICPIFIIHNLRKSESEEIYLTFPICSLTKFLHPFWKQITMTFKSEDWINIVFKEISMKTFSMHICFRKISITVFDQFCPLSCFKVKKREIIIWLFEDFKFKQKILMYRFGLA